MATVSNIEIRSYQFSLLNVCSEPT